MNVKTRRWSFRGCICCNDSAAASRPIWRPRGHQFLSSPRRRGPMNTDLGKIEGPVFMGPRMRGDDIGGDGASNIVAMNWRAADATSATPGGDRVFAAAGATGGAPAAA